MMLSDEFIYWICEVSFSFDRVVVCEREMYFFGSVCLLRWLSDLSEHWMTGGTIDLHSVWIAFYHSKRKTHTKKSVLNADDRMWMEEKSHVLSMSKSGTHNLLLSCFPIHFFHPFSLRISHFFKLWFQIYVRATTKQKRYQIICAPNFFDWTIHINEVSHDASWLLLSFRTNTPYTHFSAIVLFLGVHFLIYWIRVEICLILNWIFCSHRT